MNYKRKLLVLSATVGLGLSMLATQSSAITYHYNHITSQKTVFAMTTGESMDYWNSLLHAHLK